MFIAPLRAYGRCVKPRLSALPTKRIVDVDPNSQLSVKISGFLEWIRLVQQQGAKLVDSIGFFNAQLEPLRSLMNDLQTIDSLKYEGKSPVHVNNLKRLEIQIFCQMVGLTVPGLVLPPDFKFNQQNLQLEDIVDFSAIFEKLWNQLDSVMQNLNALEQRLSTTSSSISDVSNSLYSQSFERTQLYMRVS